MDRRAFIASAASFLIPGVATATTPSVRRTPSVAPPEGSPVAQPRLITRIRLRRHVGSHTHTCPSCGKAWDHSMDGNSHRCPWCQRGTQTTIDVPPRMIEVHETVTVQETVSRPEVSVTTAPTMIYRLPSSENTCGPGGCPTSTTYSRPGLFRGR